MKKYLYVVVAIALILGVFGGLGTASAQGPGESIGGDVDSAAGAPAPTDTPAAAPIEAPSAGVPDEGAQAAPDADAPAAAPVETGGDAVEEIDSVGSLDSLDTVQAAELNGTAASDGPWSATVYVSNPNATAATADIVFYNETGTQVTTKQQALNAFGSAVVDVAAVGNNFKGSAVVSSDATLAVQVGLSVSPVIDRMLYSGFSQGANKVSSPALLCNIFGQNSDLVVMNTGSAAATVTVNYVATLKNANDPSQGTYTPATKQTTHTIPANSSKYLSACSELGITKDWSGSVTVTGGTSDQLVAVVFQPFTNSPMAAAYETVVGEGGDTVFFPQAMNQTFSTEQTTFYALQNVGNAETTVTLTIYDGAGAVAKTANYTLAPGGKVTTGPSVLGVPAKAGFSGSAVAKASSGGKIAAVTQLKPFKDFAGCPATSGILNQYLNPSNSTSASSNKLAVPWIEYKETTTDWQAFVAVQNVNNNGSATGKITVTYYNPDGSKAGSKEIASLADGAKATLSSSTDGVTNGKSFVGSMVIESANATDKLVATSSNKQANGCNGSGAPAIVIK